MKPQLRRGVSLRSLLLLCALVTVSQAQCDNIYDNTTATINATTTTVTVNPTTCNNFTGKDTAVKNLAASDVSTSSIFLSWTGNWYFFRVEWTNGSINEAVNVTVTQINITGLTAGVQYKVTVYAVAEDGVTEGAKSSVTTYTIPTTVENLTITNVTTSSVSLSWHKPEGNVESYRVWWTDDMFINMTSTTITDLTPGSKYNILVAAVVENSTTEGQSAFTSTFTRPTKPGNITVMTPGTDNLNVQWTLLEGGFDHFMVNISNQELDYSNSSRTTNKTANFTNLHSGRIFVITVTAVAGNFSNSSEPSSFATRPNPVLNLVASPKNTTSAEVTWSYPQDAQSDYKYLVQACNNTGVVFNATVSENSTEISNLEPGTRYNISVKVIASAGSESTEEQTYSYTRPMAVTDLNGKNVTTTSIQLTWVRQNDHKPTYSYLVIVRQDAKVVQNYSTNAENHTFFNLTPGVLYTFDVFTVVEGVNSSGSNISISTKPNPVLNLVARPKNTSSVEVTWSYPQDAQRDYKYLVQACNDTGVVFNATVSENSTEISNLEPGTRYNISVKVITSAGSESAEEQTYSYTRPMAVTDLNGTNVTTTSIQLTWVRQNDHKPTYSYLVIVRQDAKVVQNYSTNAENHTFFNLIPGVSYTFDVFTVVGGVNSSGSSISISTRPNPVLNLVASPKNTTSVEVTWSYPLDAQRDYKYLVQACNDTGVVFNATVSENSTEISNLEPGTRYNISVKVIASTGSESTEEQTYSYTRPMAVTDLNGKNVTPTSIQLTWVRQNDHKPTYSYLVIVRQVAEVIQNYSTNAENHTFFNLTPGVSYTFDVFTVVEGVNSSGSSISISTELNPVLNLVASPKNTTSVEVTWSYPQDAQRDYKYLVQACNDTGVVFNATVNDNSTEISNLEPGTRYNISVKVIASTGSESTEEQTYSYTRPMAVTDLNGTNVTPTSIQLTWVRQNDHKPTYSYLVIVRQDAEVVQNYSTNAENHTFFNLTPGVLYTFDVFTVVEGVNSSGSSISNFTIPTPPGPISVESQTVNSINFTWSPPEKMEHGQYNFSVSSLNGTHLTPYTRFQLEGLESGSPYNISVVTVGVMNSRSTQVTAENYTRPHPVSNLRVKDVTADAVTLLWEQKESKPHYSYIVQVSNGSTELSVTVSNTMHHDITGLFPGNNYSFTVTTQTADGTSAAPVTVSQFTKPVAVKPTISSQGSNSSVLVSWHRPCGNVEFYRVFLTLNTSEEEKLRETVNTSYLFTGLSAGRLYSAKVFTVSGPGNASSAFVSNATYPNPPGPIEILLKTTSSIGIRWTGAPLMSGVSFQYRLSITSPEADVLVPGNNSNHTFDSLRSGTSFDISVVTVGAWGFESEAVRIHMVTTRPFSVENLSASTEEEAVTVTWSKPPEYKESYRYNVTWQNSQEARSNMTDNTEYNITDLVPGTQYNFSVTTETSDGTQAVSTQISNCTDASPVTDLRCEGPNTKNARLLLSWKVPKGQHSGFQVAVNDSEMITSTGTCCNQTVPNLLHYTVYKPRVVTLSCGRPSVPVIHVCRTGITDPPILEPSDTLVSVVQKTHKSFSLQINSSLLNDANGPITHIGVLVAADLPSNTSNWRTYLEKNYDQFKNREAPVYLATLREKNIAQSRSGESRLNIEVGDGSEWEGYRNGPLDPGERYQYAIVVFTNVSLQNNTVDGEQSLVSITVFYAPVELFINPAIAIASGTTVGIFCVLLLVLGGFIIYWRRLSQKEQTDIQIHSMREKVSVEVRTEDYELYYKKQKADSNCGFAEEFEDLKVVGTSQSKSSALMLENKPKNRYNNVLPYDSSRVKLSIIHGSPYDDYINANYIPGYNSKKEFIAAQGPLPATVKDFWRMIWEKNVQTLVMLTRCNEQGRVKCERYWDFGTKHFENINVTMTSEIPLEDWTIREFDIKNVKTAETRSVRQFHFTAWPDHGVPETTELLIGFRHLVREHMDQYSRHSPTVVHCSAGVGRTGTFIAIDRLIFQIERENIVDVYGIVHDLRMHRPLMVQTEDQYVFLNQCAMDIIRSRTGTNVDLIYQNTAALNIYENIEPKKGYHRNGYRDA